MEEFLNLVQREIGVDESVAKMAVGHVLAFLQKECSEGALKEFFDKVPGAKALVENVESEPASSGSVLGEFLFPLLRWCGAVRQGRHPKF